MRPREKCPHCGEDLDRLYTRDMKGHRSYNYNTWGFHCPHCNNVFIGETPDEERKSSIS